MIVTRFYTTVYINSLLILKYTVDMIISSKLNNDWSPIGSPTRLVGVSLGGHQAPWTLAQSVAETAFQRCRAC